MAQMHTYQKQGGVSAQRQLLLRPVPASGNSDYREAT